MQPFGVAVAPDGSIYVSDRAAQRIVRIAGDDVRVVAGRGPLDASGVQADGGFENGPAQSARFNAPAGLAFDGNALLIADSKNSCIRKLENGIVSTFSGGCGEYANRNSATPVRFIMPMGIAVLPGGEIYVADAAAGLRKIEPGGAVTAIAVPSSQAYGLSYEAASASLWVTTADGIFVVRREGVIPVPSHLSFDYTVGYPFGIVALNDIDMLYTDAETGALRFLEAYTGNSEVLAGSGMGADYRAAGRRDGPLSSDSFVQPLGLAMAPDHSVIVADGFGRVVRRIAPWHDLTLQVPAASAVPKWHPDRFRIAFIGNSTIWEGTTWYDSIEGRLQTQLDTPAFHAAHGEPDVEAFWIVGEKQFSAGADYGRFLVENGLADAIVLQQNSVSVLGSKLDAQSAASSTSVPSGRLPKPRRSVSAPLQPRSTSRSWASLRRSPRTSQPRSTLRRRSSRAKTARAQSSCTSRFQPFIPRCSSCSAAQRSRP